jgi:hypothetical protein
LPASTSGQTQLRVNPTHPVEKQNDLAGVKRATVAVAGKLAVIMHRIWVTGDEFDSGGPAVAAKAACPMERGAVKRPGA